MHCKIDFAVGEWLNGRVVVSKTIGCVFESRLPCQKERILSVLFAFRGGVREFAPASTKFFCAAQCDAKATCLFSRNLLLRYSVTSFLTNRVIRIIE